MQSRILAGARPYFKDSFSDNVCGRSLFGTLLRGQGRVLSWEGLGGALGAYGLAWVGYTSFALRPIYLAPNFFALLSLILVLSFSSRSYVLVPTREPTVGEMQV